mgnify:CR=1 FL=1
MVRASRGTTSSQAKRRTARTSAENILGYLKGWTDQQVTGRTALIAISAAYSGYSHLMLGEGVYLPPSQLEAAFFSAAHAKKDIHQLIERVDRVFKKLAWEFGS